MGMNCNSLLLASIKRLRASWAWLISLRMSVNYSIVLVYTYRYAKNFSGTLFHDVVCVIVLITILLSGTKMISTEMRSRSFIEMVVCFNVNKCIQTKLIIHLFDIYY